VESPPRVALMQPAVLAWQGYFGLVAAADVFVLLDDFSSNATSPFTSGTGSAWPTGRRRGSACPSSSPRRGFPHAR